MTDVKRVIIDGRLVIEPGAMYDGRREKTIPCGWPLARTDIGK